MLDEYNLAKVSNVFADKSRILILSALADGTSRTVTELAKIAKISKSTCSEHLTQMLKLNFLFVNKCGKYSYYKIANKRVVEILEQLALLAPQIKPYSLKTQRMDVALTKARLCYDHLAGKLGVLLTHRLVELEVFGLVEDRLTVKDKNFFIDNNFEISNLQQLSSKPIIKNCIDCTERKYHVAGLYGAIIAHTFLEKKWVKKVNNSARALKLTPRGLTEITQIFEFNSNALNEFI